MPAAAVDNLGSNTSITNSPIAEKFVSVGAILNKVDSLPRENLISGGALASKICQDAGLNEGWLDARLALATAGADLAVANLQLSELFATKRLGQLLRPLEKMGKSRTKSERERALGGLLKMEEFLDAVNAFGQKDVAGGVPPLRDVSFDLRVLATERNATTNPFNSIGVRLAEVVLAIDARLDKETKRELLRLPDPPPVESPMYQKIRVELDLELARRTRETPALREGAAEREGVHRMAKLADLAMSVYGSKEAVQNYEAGRNYAPVHSEEDHLRDTYPKDVAKITPEWRAALRTALVANGMPSLCNSDVLERILFRDKPGSGRAGSAVRSVPKLLIRLSEHLEAREGSWADPDVGVIAGVLATSTATKLVREKIDKAQSAFEMALSDQKEIT
ncbi:MAG: hypothetical protein KDD70_13555, partial [Bdellovibrionales bacterium]|nr:hypothetical protein [Bdellovibrionales bacterium]